jgi:hypothetical protein
VAAYLISLSIIGLGPWIFAIAEAKPTSLLVRIGICILPVAVGAAILLNEIHIDLLVG